MQPPSSRAPADLHPLEAAALREVQPGEDYTPEALAAAAGMVLGQVNQVISWLTGKGWLAETGRVSEVEHDLTELGRSYQRDGMPEERILRQLEVRPLSLPDLAERTALEQREVGSAFGALGARGGRADGRSEARHGGRRPAGDAGDRPPPA